MLLRIGCHQAKVGMFVDSVDGSWIDNPFWSHRFRIDGTILSKLTESAVETLVIDLKKGIGPGDARSGYRPVRQGVPAWFADADTRRAVETLRRTNSALGRLFDAVREGRAFDASQAKAVVDEVAGTMRSRPRALLGITRLKSKDKYSFFHSVAVCALMTHFGRFLHLEEDVVQDLGLAGLLHDIGKVAVPSEILGKPGALTEEETALMRAHPVEGFLRLEQQDVPDMVRDVCRHHHERMDGRGYPDGLSGDGLSLPVRIAAICDVYDAVTSVRPYKEAWSAKTAYSRMWQSDGHFDRILLGRFFASIGVTSLTAKPPRGLDS